MSAREVMDERARRRTIAQAALGGPPGERTETFRYGYRPGGGIDAWVILCTVNGARGPFTATRTVVYSVWSPDPGDPEFRA